MTSVGPVVALAVLAIVTGLLPTELIAATATEYRVSPRSPSMTARVVEPPTLRWSPGSRASPAFPQATT